MHQVGDARGFGLEKKILPLIFSPIIHHTRHKWGWPTAVGTRSQESRQTCVQPPPLFVEHRHFEAWMSCHLRNAFKWGTFGRCGARHGLAPRMQSRSLMNRHYLFLEVFIFCICKTIVSCISSWKIVWFTFVQVLISEICIRLVQTYVLFPAKSSVWTLFFFYNLMYFTSEKPMFLHIFDWMTV